MNICERRTVNKIMKTKLLTLSAIAISSLLTGCASSGFSRREAAGVSYPNYILSLASTNSATTLSALARPIRLAVAQVGESAPSKELLKKLEASPDSIASVVGVPAPGDADRPYYAPKDSSQNKQVDFSTRVQSLCRLSKNLGADYLFICGGDTTSWQDSNPLRVFDITIIGGMLVPSTKINVEGRAAGALINAATGEPVLLVSTDAHRSASSPSFYADQKTDGQRVALRDELTSSIAVELLQKIASLPNASK